MFRTILVPVDLAHRDFLEKSLGVAAVMAKTFSAEITYVGVTSGAPSAVAHNPDEYADKLAAFAAEQAAKHGISATSKAYTAHDPSIQLDTVLMKAIAELGAELVVMASHAPTIADYVWPSNGGTIASHANVSVLIVR